MSLRDRLRAIGQYVVESFQWRELDDLNEILQGMREELRVSHAMKIEILKREGVIMGKLDELKTSLEGLHQSVGIAVTSIAALHEDQVALRDELASMGVDTAKIDEMIADTASLKKQLDEAVAANPEDPSIPATADGGGTTDPNEPLPPNLELPED